MGSGRDFSRFTDNRKLTRYPTLSLGFHPPFRHTPQPTGQLHRLAVIWSLGSFQTGNKCSGDGPKWLPLDSPRRRDISVTVIRHKKSWIQPRDDLSCRRPRPKDRETYERNQVRFDFSEGVTAFAVVGVWSTEPPRCDQYGSVSWLSQDKS